MLTKSFYETILNREIDYVISLSLPNGAIPMMLPKFESSNDLALETVNGISPDEYKNWARGKIVPYFSDSAVMGMMDADRVLGTQRGKDTAFAYINWYISHMNTRESDICGVAGTVYDYYIFKSTDGRLVEVTLHDAYAKKYPTDNPNDYDSTDSYAAMFLEILLAYTDLYDSSFLQDKEALADTLIDVLESTYIKSLNLTVAKPNYQICYLMDNCEVFRGYESAAGIYEKYLNNAEKAGKCREKAELVRKAILTTMWSNGDACFKAAVSPSGKAEYSNDMTEFYPQATCQLFPILFGIVDPADKKAITAYSNFKDNFCQRGVKGKDWSVMDTGATYPWCIAARAVVQMKDYALAEQYIQLIYRAYIRGSHNYPYYNSESGSIMMACAVLYELAPEDEPAESSAEDSAPAEESKPEEKSAGTPFRNVLPWIIGGACILAAAGIFGYVFASKKKKS